MSYRNSSNNRDKSREKIDTNTVLSKTKLSQTATSTESSKIPPVKRDSIKSGLPPPLPSKNKLKQEDLMTQSKIFQAKNGLQLLKKKMSQKGLLPTKSQTMYRQQLQQEEIECVGSKNNQSRQKIVASQKQIRPKIEKQPIKKRNSEVSRKQQYEYLNPHDEAPIKSKNTDFQKMIEQELRKQQKLQTVATKVSAIKQSTNNLPSEYADEEQLYQCPIGCGRTFKRQTLQKHKKVCQKVFMQQRKAFDSAAQRHLQVQVKVVPQKSKQIQSKISTQTSKLPSKQQPNKSNMPKWKLQSLQLRHGIKKAAGRQLTKEEAKVQEMQKQSLTQCSFCMRRFNAQAAKRHIPVCEQQSKRMGNKTQTNMRKK